MKHFFFMTLLSCLLLQAGLSACSDGEGENGKLPQFSISEEYLQQDFKASAASITIPVCTNLAGREWTVESDATWCLVDKQVSTTQSVLLITVHASEEPDIRMAEIRVQSPVITYIVKVRQLGYGPAILLKKSVPTVSDKGGEVAITVTSNIEYSITRIPDDADWLQETATRALVDREYHYTAAPNTSYAPRTVVFTYTYTKDVQVKVGCTITQEGKSSDLADVVTEGDFRISPIGGSDSEHQEGQGIEKTFDGKFGNADDEMFHTPWDTSASFPVVLEYEFSGLEDMDYLIYYPRNGNGNFGEISIYTATDDAPHYRKQGDYDFRMQNAPSRVNFKTTLSKVTRVKLEVKSGLGGFASCSEMEFYRKNTDKKLDRQLLAVFTDLTCSEVRSDATNAEIDALPGYFANIAVQLKAGTYDLWEKEFRLQDYHPYSNVEEWAERLMTKRYSNLDNPTGIYVEAGDSVMILVGDTHGHALSVMCVGEERVSDGSGTYLQTAAGGETRFLQEGVNKVGFSQPGMLFIIYTARPSEKNVTVHIPPGSGKVGGFFDVERHRTNDRYRELIEKSDYKYFCVRGERIIFYFHREQMKRAVPYDMLSAIGLWDDIVGWQQELMGIGDVRPSQVNNHLFAVSPEGSYMWASDYRIAFVYTYLENILLKENVMAAKDNAWGPAHEIGHIHQRAINWPGSTESSNNLFSNYILYKLGKYCSRGSELSALATARCEKGQAWWNLGSATHQNEDAELHMRMYWQLWNYYHRCGYRKDFWQTLFKLLREDRIVESDPGGGQLKFAMMASRAAGENLTDFFEMWGFFEPVDEAVEQYGTWRYRVTDAMIAEAKAYMAQFPVPRHAFYYLEDRRNGEVGIGDYRVGDVGNYSQFRDNVKITRDITCIRSGNSFSVKDGEEAVAFELRKDGKLLWFSNFYSFTVPATVNVDGAVVYAVQVDGKRIEAGI